MPADRGAELETILRALSGFRARCPTAPRRQDFAPLHRKKQAELSLQPMPSEHTISSTYEEAEQWAVQQLRRRGVEVPPRG